MFTSAAAPAVLALCLLRATAAEEQEAGGVVCADNASFRDAKGYACGKWTSNSECVITNTALLLRGYTRSDVTAMRANCPKACGLCETAAGGEEEAECIDDGSFRDENGKWGCSFWLYRPDCGPTNMLLGYSKAELDEINARCPKACNGCATETVYVEKTAAHPELPEGFLLRTIFAGNNCTTTPGCSIIEDFELCKVAVASLVNSTNHGYEAARTSTWAQPYGCYAKLDASSTSWDNSTLSYSATTERGYFNSYDASNTDCGSDSSKTNPCLCVCGEVANISHVRVSKSQFVVTEPASAGAALLTIRVPLIRTPSPVAPKFLKLIAAYASGTATPNLDVALQTLADCAASDADGRDELLVNTTLTLAGLAVASAADYELLPPFDNVTWWNETHGVVTAQILLQHDAEFEAEETFVLRLQHSSHIDDCVLDGSIDVEVVIRDPPLGIATFAYAITRASEADSVAFVELKRANGSASTLSVTISVDANSSTAINGVDYSFESAKLTWADGDSSPKAVAVVLLNDRTYEDPDKVIVLRITETSAQQAIGSSRATTSIVIQDDGDAGVLSFANATYAVVFEEGITGVAVLVERSGGSSGAISVQVALMDNVVLPVGSKLAIRAVDFKYKSPQTLSWADGEAGSKAVALNSINDDSTDRVFGLELIDASGGAGLRQSTTVVVLKATPKNALGDAEIAAISVGIIILALAALAVVWRILRNSHAKVVHAQTGEAIAVTRANIVAGEKDILQGKLDSAQKLVKQVMAEGGKLLDSYHLDYSDIDFGGDDEEERSKLGEGAHVFEPPHPRPRNLEQQKLNSLGGRTGSAPCSRPRSAVSAWWQSRPCASRRSRSTSLQGSRAS